MVSTHTSKDTRWQRKIWTCLVRLLGVKAWIAMTVDCVSVSCNENETPKENSCFSYLNNKTGEIEQAKKQCNESWAFFVVRVAVFFARILKSKIPFVLLGAEWTMQVRGVSIAVSLYVSQTFREPGCLLLNWDCIWHLTDLHSISISKTACCIFKT